MAKSTGSRGGSKAGNRGAGKSGNRGNPGWPNKKGNGNKTGPRDNASPKGKGK